MGLTLSSFLVWFSNVSSIRSLSITTCNTQSSKWYYQYYQGHYLLLIPLVANLEVHHRLCICDALVGPCMPNDKNGINWVLFIYSIKSHSHPHWYIISFSPSLPPSLFLLFIPFSFSSSSSLLTWLHVVLNVTESMASNIFRSSWQLRSFCCFSLSFSFSPSANMTSSKTFWERKIHSSLS